jgi:hypothetical protein
MTSRSLFLFSVLLIAALAGCEHRQSDLPVVSMKIGSKSFDIEIASTPVAQETGLMKRDSMPADHGMIFVFPDEQLREFWMKNTRFPLDIVFLDTSGKVVSIKQMRAYDQHTTSSDAPARFAIELNDGAAVNAGISAGDRVTIPSQVLKP